LVEAVVVDDVEVLLSTDVTVTVTGGELEVVEVLVEDEELLEELEEEDELELEAVVVVVVDDVEELVLDELAVGE